MAYDESDAYRVRAALAGQEAVTERKMFGGLAFMVHGHMCCGVMQDHLMVRVGPDQYADALAQPHAREMDFTGRPMKGIVWVDPPGFQSEAGLQTWIERGLAFVTSLPPK
jgi:TfoX/Sxy family transcriptional regulator of competence genes